MQRLHQDDLVGQSWSRKAGTMLVFPSIAEPKRCTTYQSFGRRLFSAQSATFPSGARIRSDAANIREAGREYNFAAQYQQNPTPLAEHHQDSLAPVLRGRATALNALSRPCRAGHRQQGDELSDYSVCTSGVYTRIAITCWTCFVSASITPNLKRKLRELAWRDRPNKILIEDKASGTQVIQTLKADGVHAVTAYHHHRHR